MKAQSNGLETLLFSWKPRQNFNEEVLVARYFSPFNEEIEDFECIQFIRKI